MSDAVLEKGFIPYFPKIEMEHKKKNPQRRFVLTGDDEIMARFYAQRDRYISILVNKGMALDILARMWEGVSDEQLQAWSEHGE